MNERTNNSIKCAMALTALYQVFDPELGINVVDMGLIYAINFNETEKQIYCEMTLSTPFCPMGDSITQGVKNALEQAFPEYALSLELTFDPPWTQEHISEEGRIFLNN